MLAFRRSRAYDMDEAAPTDYATPFFCDICFHSTRFQPHLYLYLIIANLRYSF